jgi:hypothetical protein
VITREGISLAYGIVLQVTHIHNFNYEAEENYVLMTIILTWKIIVSM